MRRLKRLALVAFGVGATVAACVGAGEGHASGPVNVPICRINRSVDWTLNYFAAERTGRILEFRAQTGGGVAEYTDHLYIRIDDTLELARRIASSNDVDASGQRVYRAQVAPQGTAGVLVHGYLALRWSCGRTKTTRLGYNVALPIVRGTMEFRSVDQGGIEPPRWFDPPQPPTDVSFFDLSFEDSRPVGDPPPTNPPLSSFTPPIQATDPIGSAQLRGRFRFVFDSAVPAQGFPGP
jgi:hypothetical protein